MPYLELANTIQAMLTEQNLLMTLRIIQKHLLNDFIPNFGFLVISDCAKTLY